MSEPSIESGTYPANTTLPDDTETMAADGTDDGKTDYPEPPQHEGGQDSDDVPPPDREGVDDDPESTK